jgi:hypothetical protein
MCSRGDKCEATPVCPLTITITTTITVKNILLPQLQLSPTPSHTQLSLPGTQVAGAAWTVGSRLPRDALCCRLFSQVCSTCRINARLDVEPTMAFNNGFLSVGRRAGNLEGRGLVIRVNVAMSIRGIGAGAVPSEMMGPWECGAPLRRQPPCFRLRTRTACLSQHPK